MAVTDGWTNMSQCSKRHSNLEQQLLAIYNLDVQSARASLAKSDTKNSRCNTYCPILNEARYPFIRKLQSTDLSTSLAMCLHEANASSTKNNLTQKKDGWLEVETTMETH